MLELIFSHSSGLNGYFLLLNSGEGWPINAAFALYVLHSFYPAKHTTLILSKARNIPERALVGAYEGRERSISMHGISWDRLLVLGKLSWETLKELIQTLNYEPP